MKKIVFYLNNNKKEGLVLKETQKELTIKLNTGYNVILNKEDIKIISSKEIRQDHSNRGADTSSSSSKKTSSTQNLKILILHTGGTIASKIDYETGAVSSKFTPEELLSLFPELNNMAYIDSYLVRNIASDDMRFSHYNLLIKKIYESQANYDGVIITHGTDTMHYTASALYYALPVLQAPVLLVGAQRSSDRPSSDAFLNLVSAIKFIEFNKNQPEKYNQVGICMHETLDDETCLILPGTNTKKLHSSRRDAFKPINKTPVARINYYLNKVEIINKNYFSQPKTGKAKRAKPLYYNEELKIGLLKAHPNMWPEEIKLYESFNGLIIEGTGLGHLPINSEDPETEVHKEIFKALEILIKKGVKVVMSTQTTFGRVNMNVYSPGRKLLQAGVIGNLVNTCSETLFIKLALALSNPDKIKLEEFIQNGE